MKKILFALTLALLVCSCGKKINFSEITIKDGMDNPVKVDVSSAFEGYEDFINQQLTPEQFTSFVQRQYDNLKGDCKNPLTFIPRLFNSFDTLGTCEIDYRGNHYVLYEYKCLLYGIAKNGFGVEGEVHKFIGKANEKDELGLYKRAFLMKDNWDAMHPHFSIFSKEDYDIIKNDEIFKSLYDFEPFYYKDEELYFGYSTIQFSTSEKKK